MKQLSIALTDSEIQKLQAASMEGVRQLSTKKSENEQIDIKTFSAQVAEAGRAKPLPGYIL